MSLNSMNRPVMQGAYFSTHAVNLSLLHFYCIFHCILPCYEHFSMLECKATAHGNEERKKVQIFWPYSKGRKI